MHFQGLYHLKKAFALRAYIPRFARLCKLILKGKSGEGKLSSALEGFCGKMGKDNPRLFILIAGQNKGFGKIVACRHSAAFLFSAAEKFFCGFGGNLCINIKDPDNFFFLNNRVGACV